MVVSGSYHIPRTTQTLHKIGLGFGSSKRKRLRKSCFCYGVNGTAPSPPCKCYTKEEYQLQVYAKDVANRKDHSYIVPGSALSLYSCGKLWIFLILISSLQGLHGTGLGRDALARTLTSSLLVCGGLGDPETLCALRRNLPIRTWCFGRLETWRP